MSEEIEVREVHEGDAEAFLDLLTRIDAETDFMLFEAGERMTTVVEQCERIKGVLSKENRTILVACHAKQLVGLQAFTGRHIGTRLFTALESWARLRGIEHLELTVRTDNERGTGRHPFWALRCARGRRTICPFVSDDDSSNRIRARTSADHLRGQAIDHGEGFHGCWRFIERR